MRKIKITALILAVLMVMAAFAGCASKSTVEDLDSRVEALEGKIDANQKANEELLAEIKDLIAGNKSDSEKALADAINGLKDLVNSNKETTDKALTDAINNLTTLVNNNKTASDKALTDAIAALNALVAGNKTESDKALADILAAIEQLNKDKTAAETAAAELQAAQVAAQTALATLEATYTAKAADYTAADNAKILEIIALAKINVNGAATKAAVEAIVPAVIADLAEYAQVNDALFNVYVGLKGNIADNDATKELVKAAKKALADAKTHYTGKLTKITAYVTGKAADGKTDITIDLDAAITKLVSTYESTDSTKKDIVVKDETATNVTYATLAYVKAEGAAIKLAITNLTKNSVTLAQFADVNALANSYTAWAKFAELLSADNLAIVDNKAKLDAASASIQNLVNAQNAYKTLGVYDASIAQYATVFADYVVLENDRLFTTLATYNKIDAVLNAWIAQYGLDAANVAWIVNNTPLNYAVNGAPVAATVNYDTYKQDELYVQKMAEKYAAFESGIVTRITNMNEITELTTTNFTEYTNIAKAIETWAKFTADVKYGTVKVIAKNALVDDANYAAMVVKAGLKDAYTETFATAKAASFLGLYTFDKAAYTEFFRTTYKTAAEIADYINDQIVKDEDSSVTAIDWAKEYSILKYLTLEGRYVEDAGVYTVKTAAQLKAEVENKWFETATVGETTTITYKTLAELQSARLSINIAAFEAVYKTEQFDLASALINYDALAENKAKLEAKLTKLATDAATIISKSNAILSATDYNANKLNQKVNLAKETAVNEAYALYEAWVANGGIFEMASFGLVKDSTTKYEFKAMLEKADTNKLTALKVRIDALRAEADALVAAYKALGAMNTYKAFAVDTVKASGAITAFTYAKKNSTGVYYVADTAEVIKAVNWTESTKESSAAALEVLVGAATYTQFDAIQAVAVAYATFVANNNNATYAAVETAKAACDVYEFLAKKAVAYANVKALIEGTAPAVTDAAEKVLVNTTLKTIIAANDLAIVESALENLANDLNKTIDACVFAGQTIIAAK